MIDFKFLEENKVKMKNEFLNNQPYEHIIIDKFCNEKDLEDALDLIPDAKDAGHSKSNDYIFAKYKFEKADFHLLSPQQDDQGALRRPFFVLEPPLQRANQ